MKQMWDYLEEETSVRCGIWVGTGCCLKEKQGEMSCALLLEGLSHVEHGMPMLSF